MGLTGARILLTENSYRITIPDGRPYRSKSKRGRVSLFTKASRVRLLERAARVRPNTFRFLVTLTYPGLMQDGEKAKAHLGAFVKRWRRFDEGACGLWVAEFQERGALHFHLWVCPGEEGQSVHVLRNFVRRWWRGVIGEDARTSVEAVRKPWAVAAYALKYGAKESQKKLPDGLLGIGRWWAFFGRVPEVEQGVITDRAIVEGVASRLLSRKFLYRFRMFTSAEERQRFMELVADVSVRKSRRLVPRKGKPIV